MAKRGYSRAFAAALTAATATIANLIPPSLGVLVFTTARVGGANQIKAVTPSHWR